MAKQVPERKNLIINKMHISYILIYNQKKKKHIKEHHIYKQWGCQLFKLCNNEILDSITLGFV